jgi:hypothetical protein
MDEMTPKRVRRFARQVAEYIGTEPEITQPGPLRWTVTLAGAHVVATAEFRAALGQVRHEAGTLTIDGVKRRPAEWSELRELWFRHEQPSGDAELDPVPPLPGGAVMPAEIATMHRKLTEIAAKHDGLFTVAAGYDGGWVLALLSDAGGVRLAYHQRGGRWVSRRSGVQVILNGLDMSAGLGGDPDKALAALTGATGPAAPPLAPADGQLGRGKRDIGVEQRKGNVIRV